MENTVDYYMNLNYTVELEGPYGHTFQASMKEMPECKVSARQTRFDQTLLREPSGAQPINHAAAPERKL